MMKELKAAILIIVVVLLTIATAHAQRKFPGKVVEVIDGRTCVLELPSGRLTAVLQYIETPDADQPLHEVVTAHFRSLVIGKLVEFSPRVVMRDRTVGQMLLGGVDVGQQLLRDGAAWHSLPEKSGQDVGERGRYEQNEALAKSEKRGVWSIDQLKPTWEYRAEQEALAAKAQKDAIEKARIEATWKVQNRPVAKPSNIASNAGFAGNGDVDLFKDAFDENKYDQSAGFGGLRQKIDADGNGGRISTPTIHLDFPKSGFLTKVNARLLYCFRGQPTNIQASFYMFGLVAVSKSQKLKKNPSFIVIADGRRIDFGRALYFSQVYDGETAEMIFYKLTAAQIQKIAAAREIKVQLGPFTGSVAPETYEMLRNIYAATSN